MTDFEEELLDEIRMANSTLNELSDKIDENGTIYSLDDVCTRLDELLLMFETIQIEVEFQSAKLENDIEYYLKTLSEIAFRIEKALQ